MTAPNRFGSASRWLLLACVGTVSSVPGFAATPRAEGPSGKPQTLLAGRAVLYDEADEPALRSALTVELRRLFEDLYGRQGWRAPFEGDEPLQIFVGRHSLGAPRDSSEAGAGRLGRSALALHVECAGFSTAQIVREVDRRVARATLAGYDADEDEFLTASVAEAMIGSPLAEARGDDTLARAAAPLVDFRARPETLGRLWVEEIIRATGGGALLREAWEKASSTGQTVRDAISRSVSDATGISQEALLARCAARLYALIEPDVALSRLRLLDLESGALDAAAPADLVVRHRSFLPEGAEDGLHVRWPEDGSAGAAVVRYRDAALAADVVFFRAGDSRAIPLSGVARIDFLVAGSGLGGRGVQAPAYCETSAAPFRGLDVHASAGREGPRLTWSTSSHEGLWGWAIFREEVLSDGRIARTGPEIVPSSERSDESFRYVFVDSGAAGGTFYRYTAWAVTGEGLLARAFAVTLKTEP